MRSARRALPLPPGLRSGAGRRGLKIPGGGGSGSSGSGAAGLWAPEAVRAGVGPAHRHADLLPSVGGLPLAVCR